MEFCLHVGLSQGGGGMPASSQAVDLSLPGTYQAAVSEPETLCVPLAICDPPELCAPGICLVLESS